MSNPSAPLPAPRHTFRTAFCGPLAEPLETLATLETVGWTARADSPPAPLPLSVEAWDADPFHDRNWRFQLHSWRPIDPYVVAHDMLGDAAHLDRAVAVMKVWATAEAAPGDDALYWNDMGSGLRAAKLAYVVSRLAPDHPDRAWVEAMARRHLARLRDEGFYSTSNHGLFQVHGLVALLNALPDAPEAEGGQAFAERMLDRILDAQFGQEGVHLEHSPGYHLFVIQTLRRMIATGWYGAMPHLHDIVTRARAALPWMVFPNGLLSGAGDTDKIAPSVRKPREAAAGIHGRLFREAGYAVVRSGFRTRKADASMLFVTGGHHSHVHKHTDELSFEWFERGRMWIVDTGKYTYSKADWRAFTNSARAHNGVELTRARPNNALSVTPPAGGLLTDLRQDGPSWEIEGELSRPAIGARHHRLLRYLPGKRLTLVDTIQLDEPGEVTAWLHPAPHLIAAPRENGWRFKGGRIAYTVEGADMTLTRARGQTEPELQGWYAPGYHQIIENDALGARLTGRTMRLTTVITLTAKKDPAKP